MIKIEKFNVFSRVVSFDTPVEEARFRENLRFKIPNYFWIQRYSRRGWDGTHSFYNKRTRTFPTGMLLLQPEDVLERCLIIDRRRVPVACETLLGLSEVRGVNLRDYQCEAIEEAVNRERCVLESPTGSGKTEIAIGIVFSLAVRTLFCVHLENLLYQAKERFEERLGIRIGMISSEVWDPREITVAMLPTIASRLKNKNEAVLEYLMTEVDCLILDEVHHLGSSHSWETPAKYCDAYYRYGLSATPVLKGEIANARLIGQTGEVIEVVSKQELIERGVIAKPTITIITNQTIFGTSRNLSWQDSYREFIETNRMRNRIIAEIVEQAVLERKQILVFLHTIRHAENLMEIIKSLGTEKVRMISGAIRGEERQELLKKLDRKDLLCIVATPVFDEGADIPNLQSVVIGGGGKSPIKLIQRMGRGMRKKTTGKNEVEIYDFVDDGNRYTKRHAIQRLQIYKRDGFEIEKKHVKI